MKIDFPRGVEVVCGPLIINDKNQVLLIKSYKWGDVWLFCGGHVDVGETLEAAVVRETKEELGIDIEVISFLYFDEEVCRVPDFYRNAHLIFFNYLAKAKSYDFKFNDEISEAKWFDIDEALSLPNLKKSNRIPIKIFKEILAKKDIH